MAENDKAGVFLDRDGVINKVVMREGKPGSPRSMEEFEWEDGAQEAIATLKNSGYPIIVVTNQPDVARNKMDRASINRIHQRIYDKIKVDEVVVCVHDDADACHCRKPNPGMLIESAKKWNFDCKKSFIVGDGWKDMEAGKAAGCTTILLDRPYNENVACDFRVKNIQQAVSIILT